MITTLFFYSNDKDLKKIQQIITSIKVLNLAKQVVGATTDLTIMVKEKQLDRNGSKPNKEYFNYGKNGDYARYCYSFTFKKRKPVEESIKEAKHVQ